MKPRSATPIRHLKTVFSWANKAILDQGWGEFRLQLDYKSAWRGGHLVAVNQKKGRQQQELTEAH